MSLFSSVGSYYTYDIVPSYSVSDGYFGLSYEYFCLVYLPFMLR